MLRSPAAVARDPLTGDVLIADSGDHRIRRVHDGVITTLAGTGVACSASCGDGGPASGAGLHDPSGLAIGAEGAVFIADTGAHRVRRVAPGAGDVTTIAGDGTPCSAPTNPCGDGGPPQDGKLTAPAGLALTGDVLLIADSGANRIRRAGAALSTIAGTGEACALPPSCGDGGAATLAQLSAPAALAADARGDVFVADSGAHLVRWLTGPAVPAAPAGPEPVEKPAGPPAAEQQVSAVPTAPKPPAARTARRAAIVRCSGRRCRVAAASAATTAQLRRRASSARDGASWARVELRRGGRRWALGAGRTLARALTLLPSRRLTAGRYRLRITQADGDGQRRRDRIVRLR
jgi:hypothetical protein